MKKRRPPTRSGKPKVRLPTDIADAAEAALDDMLSQTAEDEVDEILDEEPRTETRSPSHDEIFMRDDSDDDEDELLTNRGSKMPLPAPPRTTSVQTLARPSPHPHVTPARVTPTPTRPTPTGPPTPIPRASPMPRPSPLAVSRPRTTATVGETPRTRGEYTTAERDEVSLPTGSITHAVLDETSPVPDDLIVDLQSAPVELPLLDSGPVATVEVPRPAIDPLQVVVFEESAHLGSAQSAISASGHVIACGCTGKGGVARALDTIAGGEIDVVVAALPGGEAVIEAALAAEPRPVVIASLGGLPLDAIARAQRAGADLAITRPHDVERLAPIMLAASRLHLERRIAAATRSVGDELAEPGSRSLVALDVFERMLDVEIKRAQRYEYALSVALFALAVDAPSPPSFITGVLRARAGNALIHALRDIDIATQLEHDRFLVLLPYTDLKAAAALGRRAIAAVAKADPVHAGGRSFPLRLVGAIAGSTPGQPLSYAKLMKDATRTLEQARRDGAELAVQP